MGINGRKTMKCIKKHVHYNGKYTIAKGEFVLDTPLPLCFEILKKLKRKFPYVKFVGATNLRAAINRTGVAKWDTKDRYSEKTGMQIAEEKMYTKAEAAAKKLLRAWVAAVTPMHMECMEGVRRFSKRRKGGKENEV